MASGVSVDELEGQYLFITGAYMVKSYIEACISRK